MIASRSEQNKVRNEIMKICASENLHVHKRERIGKLLHDLARFAGREFAIELIHDLKLDVIYDIQAA